jgi:hypothetical protein
MRGKGINYDTGFGAQGLGWERKLVFGTLAQSG